MTLATVARDMKRENSSARLAVSEKMVFASMGS